MKKIFNILLALFVLIGFSTVSNAMTFQEAIDASYKKPALVVIYANWADNYQGVLGNFNKLKNTYGNNLNFIELNIADADTKSFNNRYHIYPGLPYILMFKEGGKVSRYIPKNCAIDYNCTESKVKSYIY